MEAKLKVVSSGDHGHAMIAALALTAASLRARAALEQADER